MKSLKTVVLGGALVSAALGGRAAIVLNPGNLTLAFDTAEQTVTLDVFNDGAPEANVLSLSFNISVRTTSDTVPTGAFPKITSVDLSTGTIFAPTTPAQSGGILTGNTAFEGGIIAGSGTVTIPSGSSRIATIKFDTTGVLTPTDWNLVFSSGGTPIVYLDNTASELANFSTVASVTLSVVPEPEVTAAAGLLLGFAGLRWWQRGRR